MIVDVNSGSRNIWAVHFWGTGGTPLRLFANMFQPKAIPRTRALQATVYLRGANVTSFKVGGVEWIGLRADCKLDGSKANISGGIMAKRCQKTVSYILE